MMLVVVVVLATVRLLEDDWLTSKFVSPLYSAVMVCVPEASSAVVTIAWPAPSSVAVANAVPASLKMTVPVGMLNPGGVVTAAVKLTGWPKLKDVSDAFRLVLLLARATVWVSIAVVASKLASPGYTTLTECAPTVRLLVLKLA